MASNVIEVAITPIVVEGKVEGDTNGGDQQAEETVERDVSEDTDTDESTDEDTGEDTDEDTEEDEEMAGDNIVEVKRASKHKQGHSKRGFGLASMPEIHRPSTAKLVQGFDLDGDGRISFDEILYVAEELKNRKKREKGYKATICLLIFVVVMLVWAIFGVSMLAATLVKDTEVSEGKLFTAKNGDQPLIVGTQPILTGNSIQSSGASDLTVESDACESSNGGELGGVAIDPLDEVDGDVGDVGTGGGDIIDGGDVGTGGGDIINGGDVGTEGDIIDGGDVGTEGGDIIDGGDVGTEGGDIIDDSQIAIEPGPENGGENDVGLMGDDICDLIGGADIDLKSVVKHSVRKLMKRNHKPKAFHSLHALSNLVNLLQNDDETNQEEPKEEMLSSTEESAATIHLAVNTVQLQCSDASLISTTLQNAGESSVLYPGSTICLEPQTDGSPLAFGCQSNMRLEIIGSREDTEGNTIITVLNGQNELPSFDDTFTITCPKFWEGDSSSDCFCSFRVGMILTLETAEFLTALALEIPNGEETLTDFLQLNGQEEEEEEIDEGSLLLSCLPEGLECYDRTARWGNGNWDAFEVCHQIAQKCDGLQACYSAESTVTVKISETETQDRKIQDLLPGDLVLSFDAHGKPVFQEIFYIGHSHEISGKDETTTLLRLHYGLDQHIDVSPYHLIYLTRTSTTLQTPASGHCVQMQRQKVCTDFAGSAGIGDIIWMFDEKSEKGFIPKEILRISTIENKYRSPMTTNGNIIVNKIAGSSYTINHDIFHFITFPLRILHSIFKGLPNFCIFEYLWMFCVNFLKFLISIYVGIQPVETSLSAVKVATVVILLIGLLVVKMQLKRRIIAINDFELFVERINGKLKDA